MPRLPAITRNAALWTGDTTVPSTPPDPVPTPPIVTAVDYENGVFGDFRFSRTDLTTAMNRFAVGDAASLLSLAASLDDGDRQLELTELIAAGRTTTADLHRGYAVGPAAIAEVMKAQHLDTESLLLRFARRLDDGDKIIQPRELELAARVIRSIVAANDVAATLGRLRALEGPDVKIEDLGVVSDADGIRHHPIVAAHFPVTSDQPPTMRVCITGGVHGDEPAGTGAALLFAEWLASNPKIRSRVEFTVVPVVNPRGLEDSTRRTPEGHDVNRSLGDSPEQKTQEGAIISAWLQRSNFDLGIDLHSGSPKRNGFWLMHRGAEDLLGPVMAAFDVEWPILQGDVRPYVAQRPGVLVSRNSGTLKDEFVRFGAQWGVTVEAPRSLSYPDRVMGEVELIHRILGAALGRRAQLTA